jgi:tetratricopeptide (TPR) repeat protein
MTIENEGLPTNAEVRIQLRRLLQIKGIKGSDRRTDLLEFVVESALENVPLTENIIGYRVFPHFRPDAADDVRTTTSAIRKILSDYYAQERDDDLVRIELPPGPKYRPVATYNPGSLAHREYLRGLSMFSQVRLREAETYFCKAMVLRPKYVEPYLALATVYLLSPIAVTQVFNNAGWGSPQHIHSGMWFPMARLLAAFARVVNPKWWRVHVIRGVVHCYQRRWDKASRAFDAALKASLVNTRHDLWYVLYLATTGNIDKACEVLRAKVKGQPTDVPTLTQCGILLYLNRDYQKAEAVLSSALEIDGRYWPALIGYILAAFGERKPEECGAFDPRDGSPIADALTKYFPGLLVLLLARAGKGELARLKYRSLLGSHVMDPFQLALAHMGLGETDEALSWLNEAVFKEFNPLVLWIHVCPVFDPLREHEGFKGLVREMKLPNITST